MNDNDDGTGKANGSCIGRSSRRSVIVNLERVKELQPTDKGQYVIILADGKRLTMSRGIRNLQTAIEAC